MYCWAYCLFSPKEVFYQPFVTPSSDDVRIFTWTWCRTFGIIFSQSHFASNMSLFNSETNIRSGVIWLYFLFMCSSCHIRGVWISQLVSNFGCLFTFCYSARTNSLKTKLQTCNLQNWPVHKLQICMDYVRHGKIQDRKL